MLETNWVISVQGESVAGGLGLYYSYYVTLY